MTDPQTPAAPVLSVEQERDWYRERMAEANDSLSLAIQQRNELRVQVEALTRQLAQSELLRKGADQDEEMMHQACEEAEAKVEALTRENAELKKAAEAWDRLAAKRHREQ